MEQLDGAVTAVNIWTATMLNATTALWIKLAEFVPNLLAFLVILTLGYIIAKIVAAVIQRALHAIKLDDFSEKIGVIAVLRRANIQRETSSIISRVVFWLLMLTFLVSATESLGLDRVSATIDAFVMYIPKVLGAVFILMVGLFIAQFVRDLVVSSAESIGSDFAAPLGSTAYGLLVVIVATLAVGELELETALLGYVISIVLLSFGAAAAIAFGIGSRDIAGNILAGNYVRELFQEGDRVSADGQTGVVHQVTAVKTEILLDNNDIVSIANSNMVESRVVRHPN
jgi:small-conductance mechanosensitive channel